MFLVGINPNQNLKIDFVMKGRIIINMTICSECGKEYGPYAFFLTGNVESFAMEETIRSLYYNEEKNEGLCNPCRNKLYKNPVKIWRYWLLARALMMVVESKHPEEKEKYAEAYKRIDKREAELEKDPAVKKIIEENRKSMEEMEDYEFF